MLKNRVIPSLLLSNGGLYKTKKFGEPVYIGDPINAIKIFNEKEVDELIVTDISASKSNTEPDFELIEKFAGECFIPLTYGGGIKTIEQAGRLFSLGIEKITIQSAIMSDFNFIKSLVECFGSSSIVASVDLKRNWLNKICVYNYLTGKLLKYDWEYLIDKYSDAGVGEIFLNCVDRDGMRSGPDFDMIKKVGEYTKVPLIACGGISSLSDIKKAIEFGADAIAAGSFFVFHGPHRAVLINYPKYKDLEEVLAS